MAEPRQGWAAGMGQFVPVIPAKTRLTYAGRADSPNGLKSSETLNQDYQAWADSQPTVTLCGLCPDRPVVCDGTAAEGRAALQAHRKAKHPESFKRKRRKEPFETDRDMAEKEADRRSKLLGVDRAPHEHKHSAKPIMRPNPPRPTLTEREAIPTSLGAEPSPVRSGPEPSGETTAYASRSVSAGPKHGHPQQHLYPRCSREAIVIAIQEFHAAHGRTPFQKECGTHGIPTIPTVWRRFGSFGRAVEAAGFTPRQRGYYDGTPDASPTSATGGSAAPQKVLP